MADGEKEEMTADLARRLADPNFRKLLTAVTPDGERPVIPALRSTVLSDVLSEVQSSGGVGNVVVPVVNGYMVLAITTPSRKLKETTTHPPLRADCTIGLLIARLFEDGIEDGGSLTYCLLSSGPKAARADLVGIAS